MKHTLLKGMVDVEVRQMVAVDVCKPHLCFVGLLLHLARTHEALRDYTTVMGEGRCAKRSRPFPLPLVTFAQHSTYILHTTPDSAQLALYASSHHNSHHSRLQLSPSSSISPHGLHNLNHVAQTESYH